MVVRSGSMYTANSARLISGTLGDENGNEPKPPPDPLHIYSLA